MSTSMQDRGFSRYEGNNGGHWNFDPRLVQPWIEQAQLGIDVADRARRCRELAARKHCSPARRVKLLRRARKAEELLK